MQKRRIMILICLVILMVSGLTAGSYAAVSDSDLYKNIDETATESGDDYFTNYRDNYQLDTEKMSFFKDPGGVIFDMFSNMIFSLQVLMAKLTISLFSFSLSSNIAATLGGFLEPFILAMRGTMWDSFAVFGIAFAAFLLLLKMAQNRTAQAMSSVVSLVLIITLAFAFYAYPMQLLSGVDTVTSGIADTVMDGPYQATVGDSGGNKDAKAEASALCWQLFVHQPWQVLEFGSVKMANRYQDDILKASPDSDQRKDKVNELAESEKLFSKSMSYQIGRLTTAIILLLFNVLLMAVLIVFAVLILGYQFLVLVYLMLGIFVFLIALIPAFGLPLIKRWGSRIICIAFTRILIVFFLSVTLVFMSVMYQFTDEYGLLATMFLILVIVAAIWFERYRLLDLFSGIRITESVPNVHRMLDQDFNAIDGSRRVLRKVSTQEMSEGTAGNMSVKNGQNDGSISSSNREGKLYAGQRPDDYTAGSGTLDLSRVNESMAVSADRMSAVSQDMSSYFHRAEELLQQQYDMSKNKSEEAAERTSKQPEYSGFVRRTDAVRTLGSGKFDDRDIASTANLIRKTEQRGGSIEELVLKNNEAKLNPQRPSELRQGTVSEVSQESIRPEAGKRKTKQSTGIQFFKESFGEEMGEDCYLATVKKYGRKFVDNFEFSAGGKASASGAEQETKEKRSTATSYAEVLRQLEQAKQMQAKSKEKRSVDQTVQKMRKNEVAENEDQ